MVLSFASLVFLQKVPVTLEGLVGSDGCVWGLQSFGFSAPYKVLDEKLGYTGQNVYEQVKKLLAE